MLCVHEKEREYDCSLLLVKHLKNILTPCHHSRTDVTVNTTYNLKMTHVTHILTQLPIKHIVNI